MDNSVGVSLHLGNISGNKSVRPDGVHPAIIKALP